MDYWSIFNSDMPSVDVEDTGESWQKLVARQVAEKKLRAACSVEDLSRMEQLFKTAPPGSDIGTPQLRDLSYYSTKVVRCLLEHGANPNAKLCWLALRKCRSLEKFKLLGEFGLDVKAEGYNILEDLTGERAILDWLLDQGADVNKPTDGRYLYRGAFNRTLGVLNNAAALGDVELFDYLVSRGANPCLSIALHHALRCADADRTRAMISHLIDTYKFDINASDSPMGRRKFAHDHAESGPPLNFAIVHRNLAGVRYLLEKGADVMNDGAYQRPLSLAVGQYNFSGFPPAIKPLLEAGADPTLGLCYAIPQQNLNAVKLFLKYGGNPDPAVKANARTEGKHGDHRIMIEIRVLLDEWRYRNEKKNKSMSDT